MAKLPSIFKMQNISKYLKITMDGCLFCHTQLFFLLMEACLYISLNTTLPLSKRLQLKQVNQEVEKYLLRGLIWI